ncbi:LacI family DNA-binding transcriptional regulator [Microbacterium sp. MAHUQ-60]|uniref:LacI family DNA-binding transcriptional regulator n=1 Tax=unclassified Microbacterium TaxID=2609290 RepID=UPI003621E373
MSEVATHAGVSLSTVSHVLNKTRPVNDSTRERVEKALRELGYRRNDAARTLAGGRSHAIGVVISGLTNQYFGPLLHAIERRISAEGYILLLGDSHDEATRERLVIDSFLGRSVDGLIVAPSAGFADQAADAVTAGNTPMVLIDRALDIGCDQVTPENRASTAKLTSHLIEHGHRRIGAIVGLAGLDSSAERRAGYLDALTAHGIDPDPRLIIAGESNQDHSRAAVEQLLSLDDPPTAFLTLNNAMTIGAMRAISEFGLRIPEDIALACYDDFEWSDLFSPGLTAIAQNVERMGREAVDLLIRRIEGDASPFEHRIVDTAFRRRTSCGCA